MDTGILIILILFLCWTVVAILGTIEHNSNNYTASEKFDNILNKMKQQI